VATPTITKKKRLNSRKSRVEDHFIFPDVNKKWGKNLNQTISKTSKVIPNVLYEVENPEACVY